MVCLISAFFLFITALLRGTHRIVMDRITIISPLLCVALNFRRSLRCTLFRFFFFVFFHVFCLFHFALFVPFLRGARFLGFLRCVFHVQLLLRALLGEEPMRVCLRAPRHRRPRDHRAYLRRHGNWESEELAHRFRALLPLARAVQGESCFRIHTYHTITCNIYYVRYILQNYIAVCIR